MSLVLEEAVTDTFTDQSHPAEEVHNIPSTESQHFEMFISDHTVPSGWRYKGTLASRKRFTLQCPGGNQYRSRSDAFEKMIISGRYSDHDILAMQSSLKYEGWEDTEALPEGWKIKRRFESKSSILVMEQGGRKFNSAMKALEFVQTYSKYYTQDLIHKLQNLASQNSRQKADESNKDILNTFASRTFQHQNIQTGPDQVSSPSEQTSTSNGIQIKKRGRESFIKWKSDDTLYPSGWMFRDREG